MFSGSVLMFPGCVLMFSGFVLMFPGCVLIFAECVLILSGCVVVAEIVFSSIGDRRHLHIVNEIDIYTIIVTRESK